ncbi:hypothetical protein BGZ82_003401 [Podila clonocystis]|nr:hypothetical protein BGZ82_003401 [Podila clonocystis]
MSEIDAVLGIRYHPVPRLSISSRGRDPKNLARASWNGIESTSPLRNNPSFGIAACKDAAANLTRWLFSSTRRACSATMISLIGAGDRPLMLRRSSFNLSLHAHPRSVIEASTSWVVVDV